MVLGVRGNDARKAKRARRVCWKRHRCSLGHGGVGVPLLLRVPLAYSTPPADQRDSRYHNLLLLLPPRAARSAAGQNMFSIVAGIFTQVPRVVAARLPQCRRGVVASSLSSD